MSMHQRPVAVPRSRILGPEWEEEEAPTGVGERLGDGGNGARWRVPKRVCKMWWRMSNVEVCRESLGTR